MHESRQAQTHPRLHPLVSFLMGVVALYCSRFVFVGSVFGEKAPLVPPALHTYAALVHLTLSLAVTLAGEAAMLSGGLSLRRSGLNSRYGVVALFGAVSGGIAFTMGLLYLSFIIHVVY